MLCLTSTLICLTIVHLSSQEKYDEAKHGTDADTYFNSAGEECTTKVVKECKFDYGTQLSHGVGDDKERTCGHPRADKFGLDFDSNGQTKPIPIRNNGRQVPYTYASTVFGANNDTQFLLMPSRWNSDDGTQDGDNTPRPITRVEIEEISNLLSAARRSGLDAANSLHIINRYLTSYCCKGGQSSANWQDASKSLVMEYCSRQGNENKRLSSIVAKLMLEVSSAMSIPRDQALFLAGEGLLKRCSLATIKKASVSSVTVDELARAAESSDQLNTNPTNDAAKKNEERFTIKIIERRYKSRDAVAASKSMYEWCMSCWSKKTEIAPMFFGYHARPTWPMSETFAKWTLRLHRPWRASPEEVKRNHGTHVEALVEYLHDEECRVPDAIWNEILRVKRNENSVVVNDSVAVAGNPGVMSPSDSRTNRHLEDAADQALTPNRRGEEEDFKDIDEQALMTLIRDRGAPPTHDWSARWDEHAETTLDEYVESYYEEQTKRTIDGVEEPLDLFQENVYRPEKAMTEEQKFLVYHHIYHQYVRWMHEHHPEDVGEYGIIQISFFDNDLTLSSST